MLRKAHAAPPTARVGATTTRLGKQLPQPEALVTYTTPPPPPAEDSNWWTYISRSMTCCVWPRCMEACGMTDKNIQQAWREKATLCMIIGFLCFFVGFFTFGLKPALCPGGSSSASDAYLNQTDHQSVPYREGVIIFGALYDFDATARMLAQRANIQLTADWHGIDISRLFAARPAPDCMTYLAGIIVDCTVQNPFPLSPALQPPEGVGCPDSSWLSGIGNRRLFFRWNEVSANVMAPHSLLVYNGAVLNLTSFLAAAESADITGMPALVARIRKSLGRDVTYLWSSSDVRRKTMTCLQRQYQAGYVDQDSTGCAAYQTIMIMMMVIIMGVVACRFVMALAFYYFFSESIEVSKYSPESRYTKAAYHDGYPRPTFSNGDGLDMYTMLLVTCYSEGGDGIRGTLESLAETIYPNERKLLFVIADGLIKGDDWKATGKTTPEIIVDMIIEDPALGAAVPKSYLAIADGAKQHNAARVHAGYFPHNGRHVPIIVVVKCGPESENMASNAKPGNRGKRDSQLILMNFLSRTLFDDRMTPLDHDLYNKIFHITGVTPDVYETILMVDADTRVSPMSLRHMNGAMKADGAIMGLCGETRIANKRDSWVTAIQVFEYYISHHLGKAFESVFGGVTCLPGCFCMYRITARKGNNVTPLLVNPDIVEEYSENVVDTLHKKNLLLLGEDRFLTTLMLRSFPKRKMVFVPKAVCHTVVPDKFRVLLSQRRRWINSTIHNLLELVLLRDLCGIFCFSMQFVIALELLGTTILPSTLLALYVLVLTSFFSPQFLPLILLTTTLLLPGILISLTTRKWVYVGYMFIYLLALPVWNFILPLYAFWRFDDFSWGETRKVVGDAGAGGHGDKDGEYVVGSVVLKRFTEWEEERMLAEAYGTQATSSLGQPRKALPLAPGMAPAHRTSLPRISPLPPGSYDPSIHRPRQRDSYDTYASGQAPLLHRRPDSFGYDANEQRRMSAVSGGGSVDLDPSAHGRMSAHSKPSTVDPLAYYTDSSAAQYESANPLPPAAEVVYAHHQIYTEPYSYDPRPAPQLVAQPSAEQLRKWQIETQRRRERESMPAGGITLNGWISDEGESVADSSGFINQEHYETHWQSDQLHYAGHTSPVPVQYSKPTAAATYRIEDVNPRASSPVHDVARSNAPSLGRGKRDLRDASASEIEMSRMDVPPVRVIPATPSDQSMTSEIHASGRRTGGNTSHASVAPPDLSMADESTAAADTSRRSRRTRAHKKSHANPDGSLGIVASKGIASTVRSFWESVGEVPPQSSRRQEPSSSGTVPSIPRRTRRAPILMPNASFAPGPTAHASHRDTTSDLSGILDRTFGLDVEEISVDPNHSFSLSFMPDDLSRSFMVDQASNRNSERYFDRSFAGDTSFGGWR
ncbi:hypothetical protein HDU86_007020 [Geranomyces michiganensis]|nr:hypothetical protein HDU86_007020 [Geranomyces michiganensis]